jgi:serine/threonine-protein kinase
MRLAENVIVADRFRLNRLLGKGGMGSVWHATHLGLDVPCAVKFIDATGTDLYLAQARFTREARAAAQLRSPHVVQILDHGVWDGTPYIAMELLEGEDLARRFARVGRLGAEEVHAILSQVCRALSKAHSVGIIHRDLKPENIFLVRDDDREIAKVLDFGIAKLGSGEAPALGFASTKTGAMVGTPYYMSPEQAQGTKTVDARSDLWSLAVIAFQALTGQLPFTSEALGDLVLKIVVNDLPVPSRLGPVPVGFDAWWQRAASRDPAGRFQTARDFADSLAIACDIAVEEPSELGLTGARVFPVGPPSPVQAVTATPAARTPEGDGRTTLLAALAGVGGALLIIAVAASLLLRRSPLPAAVAETASAAPPPVPSASASAEPPPAPPPSVVAAAPTPAPPALPSSAPTTTRATPAAPPARPATRPRPRGKAAPDLGF